MGQWDITWGRERIVNVRFRHQIMLRGGKQPISRNGQDKNEDDFEEEGDNYGTDDDEEKDSDDDSDVFQD